MDTNAFDVTAEQPKPTPIEPRKEDIILCTYLDTLDGWLAAWVLRKIAHQHKLPVEFANGKDVVGVDPTGRNWIDFGFPVEGSKAKSTLSFTVNGQVAGGTVIPFTKWKRVFPFGVETMTDSMEIGRISGDASLCALAWDFFRPNFDRRPRLIDAVNDAHRHEPKFNETKDIVACAESYDFNFQTLDRLVEACDDRKRRELIVTGGQAIRRWQAKYGS